MRRPGWSGVQNAEPGVQVFRQIMVNGQWSMVDRFNRRKSTIRNRRSEGVQADAALHHPEDLKARTPERLRPGWNRAWPSPIFFLCLVFLLITWPLCSARAQQSDDEITLTAEGMAALNDDPAGAEEEAVWDAKRNAVEQAAGVFLRARTVGRDFTLERDEVEGSTEGFIRHWEIVPGSRRVEKLDSAGNSRILHVQVRATVALLPVIHRLSDISDIYNDLERPRLHVQIDGDAHAAALVHTGLVSVLRTQGFDLVESGPAEIELDGHIEIVPTVRKGDHDTPYGIGDSVSACQAHLTLQVVSTASEDVLFVTRVVGNGQSFQSDAQAAEDAATVATDALLEASRQKFVEHLLVRWAREREEGHTVVIKTVGLDARERARLRQTVRTMRGFCRFTGEQEDGRQWSLHFLTRLATRDVRRRLTAFSSDQTAGLTLRNARGPVILCAAHSTPRLSRR